MSLAFAAAAAVSAPSLRASNPVCPLSASNSSWGCGSVVLPAPNSLVARWPRMQVGAAGDSPGGEGGAAAAAPGAGDGAFTATSESLLSTGAPIETGDDEELELAEGEEVEVLSPPQSYVNAAAIAEARKKFRRHETDSGSAEFQIATLTTRINYLTEHLKKHPKDFSSTRGLLKLVGTRRRLLKWLKSEDSSRFDAIISGMNIRVNQEMRAM